MAPWWSKFFIKTLVFMLWKLNGSGGLFFFKNPSVYVVEATGMPQPVQAHPLWCDLFFQSTRVHSL
jgi:hypothetical protein